MDGDISLKGQAHGYGVDGDISLKGQAHGYGVDGDKVCKGKITTIVWMGTKSVRARSWL